MKESLARVIACVVAFVNVVGLSPAQDYALGKNAGLARLERDLDRASLERNEAAWKKIASDGLSLAIAEWEARTISLRESNPMEWKSEREKVTDDFIAASEREYAEWLSDSFFSERGIAREKKFAAELARRAAEWRFRDKDGSEGRIIAPERATDARAQWRESVSSPMIDEYLIEWERENGEASSELRTALAKTGASSQEIETAIRAGLAKVAVSARAEYFRVAEIEENGMIAAFLYDANSLRKESESRAAAAIADRLAEKTRAETESEMNRALDSLDEEFDGGDRTGIEIDAESWMSSFRSLMESAMAKWESAESEFLVKRAEWEKETQRAYLDGEQSWADAFAELRKEREEWQGKMRDRFNEGVAKWNDRERELARMLRTARDEFDRVCDEETRKTSDLIGLEISIYDQSRSMMEMSVQAIAGWHEEWGDRYAEVYSFWKSEVTSYFSSGPLVKEDTSPSEGDTDLRKVRVSEWKIAARDMLQRQLNGEREHKIAEIATYDVNIKKYREDQDSVLRLRERLDSRMLDYQGEYAELTRQLKDLKKLESEELKKKESVERQVGKFPEYGNAFSDIDCANTTGADIDGIVRNLRDELTIEKENLCEIGDAWDAADGLIRWSEMIDTYRKKADGATQRLFEIAGNVAGASSGATYYDELHIESLKAKAISKHWADELAIAEAVDEYASNRGSSAEWGEETLRKLATARQNYESAVAEYDAEVAMLDDAMRESREKTEAMESALSALASANAEVQAARTALSDATLALNGVGLDGIRERIASLATSLRESWSDCESGKSGESAAALEYYRCAREAAQVSADAIVNRLVAGLINGSDAAFASNPALSAMRENETRASALALAEPGAQYTSLGEIPDEYASLRAIVTQQYGTLLNPSSTDAQRNVARSILSDSWRVVSAYWNEKIREREACVSYLLTGKTGYEASDPESELARAERADKWLVVQRNIIADELSIIESLEASDGITARKTILDGLAANVESALGASPGEDRAREIERLRAESPYFAVLMRMKSPFDDVCPEWSSYLYRLETSNDAECRSIAHNNAVDLYSAYAFAALNAAHETSLAAVSSMISSVNIDDLLGIDENGDPVGGEGSLAVYIERLEAAGDGLSATGKAALGNYIQGVLEYAATRCVNDGKSRGFGGSESIAERGRAYESAAKNASECGSWKDRVRDYSAALDIALSETFVGTATESEKRNFGAYLSALLIEKLSREDLESCCDRDSLISVLSSNANQDIVSYSRIQKLDSVMIDALVDGIVTAFGKGSSPVEDAESLAEWFILKRGDPARNAQKYRNDSRIQACMNADNLLSLLGECAVEDDLTMLREYAERENLAEMLDRIISIEGTERYKPYVAYAFGGADTLLFYALSECSYEDLPNALKALDAASPSYGKIAREYRNVVETANSYSSLVDGPVGEWLERVKGIDGKPLTEAEKTRSAKSIDTGLVDLDSPFHVWLARDELKPNGLTDAMIGVTERLTLLVSESRRIALDGLERISRELNDKKRSAYWVAQFAAVTARVIASDDLNLMRSAGIGDSDEDRASDALRIVKARMDAHSAYLLSDACARDSLSYSSLDGVVDPDKGVVEAQKNARSAWNHYAEFRNSESGLRDAIKQSIARMASLTGSEEEKTAALRAAESRLLEARLGYESAVESINGASAGMQAAYSAYNGRVDSVNGKYDIAEVKKLDLLKAQKVHDWATSVYLVDLGHSVDSSFETPKETLTCVRYAAKRAEIASKVLDEMEREYADPGTMRLPLDPAYSSAFNEYEESARRYNLARAVRYESELRLESVKQEVREAENAERAALGRIVVDDVSLESKEKKAIEFVDIKLDAVTGEYIISLDEGNAIAADEGIVVAYFGDKVDAIERLDGDAHQSRAKSDAIDWFVSVAQRDDSEKYLADLGLALLYAKTMAADRSADYECLFGEGSGDEVPMVGVNDYWPETFATTMHGEDLAAVYRQGRLKAIEDAYESVIGDERSRQDLAKYALYRDTNLRNLKFADSEKAQLEMRAMSYVMSELDNIIHRSVNDGIFYASGAAVLALPAIYCAPLWIAVGALTALSWTCFDKANSMTGIKSDVERNQNSKSAYAGAIRSECEVDLAFWREKTETLKLKRDKLSACAASVDDGDGDRFAYSDLSASMALLLGSGKSVVSLADAESVYSERAFDASGANAARNSFEARGLIDAYYLREMEEKQNGLRRIAEDSLIKKQNDGVSDFSSSRSAMLEIPQEIRDRMHELAKRACDKSISPELRKMAEAEYESLSMDLDNGSSLGEYERKMKDIARDALGSGTWFMRYHDNRINELNHSLGKSNAQYGRLTEPYVRENLVNLGNSIMQALADSHSSRLGVNETEWEFAARGLIDDRDEWTRQFSLIMKCSDEAWDGAETRVDGDYATWRQTIKKQYDDRAEEWKAGYDGFLDSMQRWVDEQYVYAANVGCAAVLENSESSVDAAIASATRNTLLYSATRGNTGFDSSEYVDAIFLGTGLSRVMDLTSSMASGVDSRVAALRKYSPFSSTRTTEMVDAIAAVAEISDDMKNASAALAARQAKSLLRTARDSFAARLDGENDAMREWERDLALNAGYSIATEISRYAIVDATALNNVRERQTLHIYEDFKAGNANVSVGLDDANLENLDGNAIMLVLARAQNELKSYGESIFGRVDESGAIKRWQIPRTLQESSEKEYAAIESNAETKKLIDEIQSLSKRDYETLSVAEKEDLSSKLNSIVSLRDGAFGHHVGFAPLFNSGSELDLTKSRDQNLKYGGMGEIGKIILDFQWNSFMEGKGYGELSKSIYDKRLWDDRGMSLKAPTARGVADLAMSIVSIAYGNNPFIGLIDDGVFAMIDYAGGYKTVEQLAIDACVKGACTAISFGVSWGGSVLSGFATGLSAVGQTAVNAGVAGLSSAVSTASTEFVGEIDFTRLGTSEWFDSEGFAATMTDPRTWASAVGSTVGAGLSGGLALYVGDANAKFFGGAIDLAGSIGGEAARFGVYAASALAAGGSLSDALDDMGGITVNLLDFGSLSDLLGTSIANGNASGQTRFGTLAERTRGAGLLELHIGTNGMYAQLGGNGINAGGAFYRLTKGISDKKIIDSYAAEHAEDGKGDAAYNAYVYGDWSSETTSRRIAMGKDELEFLAAANPGSVAKTTQNGNGRNIAIVDTGNSLNNAVALQHESHRDGIFSDDNTIETSESVIAHARMASEMKKRGLEINLDGLLALEVALYDKGDFKTLSAIASKCYDSTDDFWKLTSSGNLAYDGKANVYDENGVMIRETESQGVEGSMLEILGLEDNDTNRAAVVSMMISSGLEQDTKGNWLGKDVSVSRRIPYSGTSVSYLANHVNLTKANMGKEISLYSIDSLFTSIGVGKETYQNYIEKNYIS
ncbi:MAG TPA: hypothetical protein PKO22_00225, partial [Treponemataceae bacterium]|nr:hypothetical protein [Treponemataceae bacterium]